MEAFEDRDERDPNSPLDEKISRPELPTDQELAALPESHRAIVEKIRRTLAEHQDTLNAREANDGPNALAPELGELVEELRVALTEDSSITSECEWDRATRALHTQILTQLRHVSFDFEMRDNTYVHDYVIEGRYPSQPTQITLRKVEEFLLILNAEEREDLQITRAPDPDREAELKAEQKELIKRISKESVDVYRGMRDRLTKDGPDAPFEELRPVVEYLQLKLESDPIVAEHTKDNPRIARYRAFVLEELAAAADKDYGYITSVEAIQRAMEFMDVVHRGHDPDRSPVLYHSDRYDYYGHFLKATIPEHITLPTIADLGATDILKGRSVPIGLVGVNTDVTWVDGFWQTPYEFWVHDINHCRRMYQFLKETAESQGLTVDEFVEKSDKFLKEKVLPIISIKKTDNEEERNKKRLLKILLFEILHEDALAADLEVIRAGILRPPNLITPFEEIHGDTVQYIMEPGATTLAYTYRKLAHDFYDIPGQRIDYIVAPEYRTREHVAEAAETLAKHLGIEVRSDVLEYLASTDQGFPSNFRQSVENDIDARPSETIPLDEEVVLSRPDPRVLTAEGFHEVWQNLSGYVERWKLCRATFRDGKGINDSYRITTMEELQSYLAEKEIPVEFHDSYRFQTDPKTGEIALYENIRKLPHKYMAANNQYENVKGAGLAVSLLEDVAKPENHLHSIEAAVDWVLECNENMHAAWLTRNRHWAADDPNFNGTWSDLSSAFQVNHLNLLRAALTNIEQVDSGVFEPSQKELIIEALRRVSLEVHRKGKREIREHVTGNRIHSEWQERSGYEDRWKEASVVLDCGVEVTSEDLLVHYLLERNIPVAYHKYYQFRPNDAGELVLHEDIQALPNVYLTAARQKENQSAALRAISIVDRIWEAKIEFADSEAAIKWVEDAAHLVHQGVLERNVNGAKDNPKYNCHWRDLPARNQLHDLGHIKATLLVRLAHSPSGVSWNTRQLLRQAVEKLEADISSRLEG